MKKEDIKQRFELRLLVTVCVFIILFSSTVISAITVYLLAEFKFINENSISFFNLIIFIIIISW